MGYHKEGSATTAIPPLTTSNVVHHNRTYYFQNNPHNVLHEIINVIYEIRQFVEYYWTALIPTINVKYHFMAKKRLSSVMKLRNGPWSIHCWVSLLISYKCELCVFRIFSKSMSVKPINSYIRILNPGNFFFVFLPLICKYREMNSAFWNLNNDDSNSCLGNSVWMLSLVF